METAVQINKKLYWEIFYSVDFEKIVDHPNILIAANFWDADRYQAARTCYRFMRAIDDLIDNYKTEHIRINPDNQVQLEADVYHWISTVAGTAAGVPAHRELTDTLRRFHIPFWPLEAFARSMIYDIYHDGFPTLQGFIDYAGGASVAPASIFVHLCGLTRSDGRYLPPAFDIRDAATPCAIFSYLVHIIRDFRKDHLNHLNYFPDDLMIKYGLTRDNLLEMAQGKPVSDGFRAMAGELYKAADLYRAQTGEMIRRIKPLVEPRCQLSLEIIFALYLMVFERIDVNKGTFSTEELNPGWLEIKERVGQVIESFIPA
jgi:phytoene/squalene synthetase